jgi:hypothetical protein
MNKKDVKDIETLEMYYTQVRKIKFADDVYIVSLNDIYNNLWPTKFGDRRNQQPTYFNRGKMHCEIYRARSIDDFIKLCKRYFPDVTLKNCFEFLYLKELEYDEQGYRQHFGYCPTIRKYNYRGLTSSKYTRSILTYDLHDLNPVLEKRVSELLT